MSETTAVLLTGMLEIAVPLELARLRQRGGPSEADWAEAHAFAGTIAEHGDALLFRTTADDVARTMRRMEGQGNHEDASRMAHTSSHEMFVSLTRAIAVLAHCPGGARFLDLRWEAAGA